MGAQLIIRHRARGIVLTPAGHRLVVPAKALLSQANELQLLAASEGGEIAGKINVGCY
jgi:DNA-binding transcriptional LysR family regulator